MLFRIMCFIIINFLTCYLGYHAFYGQRGYFKLQEQQKQILILQNKEITLKQQKNALQNKVDLIQSNIDEDVLEQLAWKLFRYVSPNKKVMLFP